MRRTKGRREDMLPLPETTGRAIADYLRLERPQTSSRAVFVRHATPCGRPIGADAVGKVIGQAYARAGLPYTRAHLLRHTRQPAVCWPAAARSRRWPMSYATVHWTPR